MTTTKIPVDPQYMRYLVPMTDLTQDNLRELARSAFVEDLAVGETLFKKGDDDNYAYYILLGEIELDYGDGQTKIIKGATPPSRFPLDQHRPRQATARAKTAVKYTRIDNDHLDVLLTWDQNAGYMVTEIEVEEEADIGNDSDWMTHLLRTNIFHHIPPTNIQRVFMKMEPVSMHKGEVVIKQGDEGDYYYYIKEGRCLVDRLTKAGKQIKLAELEAGQSFGEEALIADCTRNANVTMLSDGVLMRLGKEDFAALLKGAVVEGITFEEGQALVREKQAQWLDVRLESEHKHTAIPGSLHVPLFLLRLKARELDKDKKYIVYCDTGRRSSSAAFLLMERGFEAYVLEGGLMALKHDHKEAS